MRSRLGQSATSATVHQRARCGSCCPLTSRVWRAEDSAQRCESVAQQPVVRPHSLADMPKSSTRDAPNCVLRLLTISAYAVFARELNLSAPSLKEIVTRLLSASAATTVNCPGYARKPRAPLGANWLTAALANPSPLSTLTTLTMSASGSVLLTTLTDTVT